VATNVMAAHLVGDDAELSWSKAKGTIRQERYGQAGRQSVIEEIPPITKRHNVGAFNWGVVAGNTQTYLPWDRGIHPGARR
jgi:hypothetical protein